MLIFLRFFFWKVQSSGLAGSVGRLCFKINFPSYRFQQLQYFHGLGEPRVKMTPRTCSKPGWVLLCAPEETRNSLELSSGNGSQDGVSGSAKTCKRTQEGISCITHLPPSISSPSRAAPSWDQQQSQCAQWPKTSVAGAKRKDLRSQASQIVFLFYLTKE